MIEVVKYEEVIISKGPFLNRFLHRLERYKMAKGQGYSEYWKEKKYVFKGEFEFEK